MSDILRDDHANSETTEQMVPHNGHMPIEAGGERPEVQFRKTLDEADREGLIVTPEGVGSLADKPSVAQKESRRFPKKTLAAVTALAVLGGGFLASRSRSSEGPKSAQPGATQPATGDTPGFVAPDFEVPEDTPSGSSEAGAGRGNIDLTRNIGRDFITATRPNGQEIKVARLGGDTPSEIASSALALFACYQTTGSRECLAAFSTNTTVQALLEDFREKEIEHVLRVPGNADMQLAVFGDPNDPPIFKSRPGTSSGQSIIELTGGTLHIGRYIDKTGTNEWQGPETRATGVLESTVRSMAFHIKQTGSQGSPTIDQFEYDIT